jgi:hypothetical protein
VDRFLEVDPIAKLADTVNDWPQQFQSRQFVAVVGQDSGKIAPGSKKKQSGPLPTRDVDRLL